MVGRTADNSGKENSDRIYKIKLNKNLEVRDWGRFVMYTADYLRYNVLYTIYNDT
jgi:hypothetical protein